MKVLLHTCCAPCSIKCIDEFQSEGIEPVIFWYNPNIHPYTEYKNRRDALDDYTKKYNLRSIFRDEYGLKQFIKGVYPNFENGCEYCYRVRLEETAKFAASAGYNAFSTTLLISPYQKHDTIANIAQEIAAKHGVKFEYRDFRPKFREGQKAARQTGVYMQKYCGCIFSEEERYLKRRAIT